MNKIALSFDLEEWYHTAAITGTSISLFKDIETFFSKWNGKYDYITNQTLFLLKLLKELNIKATFFIVADIIDTHPEIVYALRKSDHEIGCHGLHHSTPINLKTKEKILPIEEWKKSIAIAKEKLERTFDKNVIGYRAPNAYFGNLMDIQNNNRLYK